MKYLVYLLIIANLVFFAWYPRPPHQVSEPFRAKPLPPGIVELALLSERAEAAEADRGDEASDREGALDTQPVAPVETESAEDGSAQMDAEADAESAAGHEPEVVAEVEPEPEPEPEPEAVCQTIGPLLKSKHAAAIAKQLAKSEFQSSVRSGEAKQPAGYWVYLPAMPAAEARRIVADLDSHGMKDYFIGKQNYISLGIFSKKDKARVRLEKVQKLGFEAVMDQRFRTRPVFWLDVEEKGKPLLTSAVWTRILEQHGDVRVQRVSCE